MGSVYGMPICYPKKLGINTLTGLRQGYQCYRKSLQWAIGLFVPVPETPENEAELKEKIQSTIEDIFGRKIPNAIHPFLRIGLACHLHHRPKLDVLHPNDSALRLTALFTSRHIKDLQDHVKTGFPSDEDFSMYWEEPTGIPSHVIELVNIRKG